MAGVLVKFDRCWADEFDARGFRFYEMKIDFLRDLAEFKTAQKSFYFGTNEGWDAEELTDIEDDFTIIDISEDQLNALYKLFPGTTFGVFPF